MNVKLEDYELGILKVFDKHGIYFSLFTKVERKKFVSDIIDTLQGHGWMHSDEVPDCDNCDERRGEPMRNEGYD